MDKLNKEIMKIHMDLFDEKIASEYDDPEEREIARIDHKNSMERELVYGNSIIMAQIVGLSREETIELLDGSTEDVDYHWED